MTKIYEVEIEERCLTRGLIAADDINHAREKAKSGDYDLMPETALSLPNRIKSIRLSSLKRELKC